MFSFRFQIVFISWIFIDKTIESIRLEYKWIDQQRFYFVENQILEQFHSEKNLHECREFIEMFYFEEIQSNRSIDKLVPSVRIVPSNPTKKSQLILKSQRKIGDDDQSISHRIQYSLLTGHLILLPPNEPEFPLDDLQVGSTWNRPFMNSLGIIEYKLKEIDDENQFVQIEFEGALQISFDALLTGQWKFDYQKGFTLEQHIITTSSILSDQKFTIIINKTLIDHK